MSNLTPAQPHSLTELTATSVSPISIITAPPGDYAIGAGEVFELSVTLRNQGHLGAIINVFIDESSPLRQWCSTPYQRLALDRQQNCEVVFRFSVPVQTIPGFYPYLLVIDAPEHYPEHTPIQHQAKLQILPPVEAAVRSNDPTFFLDPDTTSDKPLVINPGVIHTLKVLVHNRSERVDRFRLACTDLDPSWLKITYPEGISDLGLIIDSDSLALNPGAKGEIQALITLPQTIHAGRYLGTLRLLSVNHPTLVLMNGLYLEVQPICTVACDLQPIIQRVKRQPALFHLLVSNSGNVTRDFLFSAVEAREDPHCAYTLTPDRVTLHTTEARRITIEAQPLGRWKRPWFGRGRTIPFAIALEDQHQLPLNIDKVEEELVWEARPWWHLLLVILAGLGAIATFIFLVWWVFFKPPAPPNIHAFDSVAPIYHESNDDIIHLGWEVRHPKQVRFIQLTGHYTDGTTATQSVHYDFTHGVPESLQDLCVIGKTLICNNVQTDARQVGNYTFELTVTPRRHRQLPTTQHTNTIRILPSPQPRIGEFIASQPRYEFGAEPTPSPSQAGDRNPTLSSSQAGNSQPPTSNLQNEGILLSWAIANPGKIRQLTLTGRNPQGVVTSQPQQFDFRDGIPDALGGHCAFVSSTLLCRNVPTGTRSEGLHIFELSLIPESPAYAPQPTAITQTTDTIEVLSTPSPIEQVDFKVNGEDAPAKYQLLANPLEPPILVLEWAVIGGKSPTVELLPSPGTVPIAGAIAYPVRLTTGTETITLKVTPETGEPILRSMTLETLEPEVVTGNSGDGMSNNGVTNNGLGASETPGTEGESGNTPPGAAHTSPLDTMAPPGGPLPNPLNPDADDPRPAELPPLTR